MAASSARTEPSEDGGGLARLAARAVALVAGAELIGLGSGRAAAVFIRALGAEVKAGRAVRGVPTSEASAQLARELGIPLTGLEEALLDVTVDGADEVDPDLNLIKGYGGALVRERIVAAASRWRLILVEADKLVPVLGSRGRLPVEIVPFALPLVNRRLRELHLESQVRTVEGRAFISDNGNLILDCATAPISEPARLECQLRAIPGVVDTGLFLGTADTVLVGEDGAVRELKRAR
jgi:ribose 5-phosphate isomerase A